MSDEARKEVQRRFKKVSSAVFYHIASVGKILVVGRCCRGRMKTTRKTSDVKLYCVEFRPHHVKRYANP